MKLLTPVLLLMITNAFAGNTLHLDCVESSDSSPSQRHLREIKEQGITSIAFGKNKDRQVSVFNDYVTDYHSGLSITVRSAYKNDKIKNSIISFGRDSSMPNVPYGNLTLESNHHTLRFNREAYIGYDTYESRMIPGFFTYTVKLKDGKFKKAENTTISCSLITK